MRSSLREQIVSVLSGDSALGVLVSGTIYHERPPTELGLPVLVYRFVSQRPDEMLEGGGKYSTEVHLTAFASSLDDAEDIVSTASALLESEAAAGGLDTATERVVRFTGSATEMHFPDFANEDSAVFEVRGGGEIVFFDVES